MKIKSPIVTLLVGILIAVVVAILSVRAYSINQHSYGVAAVLR